MYKKRWHLAVTFAFILAPLAYLIALNQITRGATAALGAAMFRSSLRVLVAYLIAATIAWVSAVLFYKGKRSHIALPIFDVLQSTPSFALLPIAVALFGSGETTITFFLVLAIIWPIFFSVLSSLKLIKHDWEEAVEIMQLNGFEYVRYFLWPVSRSGLITGSIIGLGDGWEALIATEIIMAVKNGLGSFFTLAIKDTNTTLLGVSAFLLLIFSINKLIWLPLLEWSHRSLEE